LVKGASCDFEEISQGVRIVYLKAPARFRLYTFFIRDIIRLLRFVGKVNPAVVHAHGTEDAYGLAVMMLKRPKVLTGQGLYCDVNKNGVSKLSPAYLLELLERFPMWSIREIIVKSKHIETVTLKYFPKLHCHIIPNTISLAFLDTQEVDKKLMSVAFVGSISPHKGFRDLRKGLELMDKKIELHVFGGGHDLQFIENEIKAIELAGHDVEMHGWVDVEYLILKLSRINLLVAPSHAESFGNQVIEGMLCLCHCVVTESTGMAENVRKYGCGSVVSQRSPQDIASTILGLLDVRLLGKEMNKRRQARASLLAELGPERIANELLLYYRKVLDDYRTEM